MIADPPAPLDLAVRDVTVAYHNGHVALHDAAFFALNTGTICGLVGVNGSGKSTLFKAIMGFLRPIRGSMRITASRVGHAHKRNWVAYVPSRKTWIGLFRSACGTWS